MGRGESKFGDIGVGYRADELKFRDLSAAFFQSWDDKTLQGVNLEALTRIAFPQVTDPLEAYAIERFLRASNMYSLDLYTVESDRGYYGEETHVNIGWSDCETLQDEVAALRELPLAKQIEKSLEMEFGYLLPSIENKQWEIIEVSVADLKLGNDEFYRPLDTKTVSHYATWKSREHPQRNLPFALVRPAADGKFLVVDGAHRVASAKRNGLSRVSVLTAKE
jgi:hypothetical protein